MCKPCGLIQTVVVWKLHPKRKSVATVVDAGPWRLSQQVPIRTLSMAHWKVSSTRCCGAKESHR
eukprot:9475530-Pyramimonas_sp.AAC.1